MHDMNGAPQLDHDVHDAALLPPAHLELPISSSSANLSDPSHVWHIALNITELLEQDNASVQWPPGGTTAGYVCLIVAYFLASFVFVWFMMTSRWPARDERAGQPDNIKDEEVEEDSNVSHEAIISIEGMHCSVCTSAVEQAVVGMPGVLRASVSLVSKSAKVTFNDQTNTTKLVTAISDQGFPSRVLRGSEVTRSAFNSDQEEARVGLRLFLGSCVFTVPVLIICILNRIPASFTALTSFLVPGLTLQDFLFFLLATPVQFGFGLRFYRSAYYALRNCQTNMDVLIVLGSSAAYFSSLILIIVSLAEGSTLSAGHTMMDASPVLITTILGGKALEATARGQATTSMRSLLALQPPVAILCRSLDATSFRSTGKPASRLKLEDRVDVPASELKVGDVIFVSAGSRVPADSTILEGRSSVDESMLTGESLPVAKVHGDRLLGGTLNKEGGLHVLVTAPAASSTVAQITKLVADAQYRRPRVQAAADHISLYFVPFVIFAALASFFGWWIAAEFNSLPRFYYAFCITHPDAAPSPFMLAFMFGCAVIVIACPCALGLATPTAIVIGSAMATRLGVLMKGGDVLEKASTVDTVLFDKTGTLTHNELSVDGVHPWSALTDRDLLSLAALVEHGSGHPIGKAISARASQLNLEEGGEMSENRTEPGGVSCRVDGAQVILGTRDLMRSRGLQMTAAQEEAMAQAQGNGLTVVLMATDKEATGRVGRLALVGMVALSARLAQDAESAVAWLQSNGIEVWMATGDGRRAAEQIAARAGILTSHVLAEMTPDAKLAKVEELKAGGKIVAMVGDGVNDAPALAFSDVGVAVARGEDVAVEAADVVLMKSSMSDLCKMLDLSRSVMRRIRINFLLAGIYNVLAIPTAAGVFFPLWHRQLSPMAAGLAMVLSSIVVVCSSLFIYCYRPPTIGASDASKSV